MPTASVTTSLAQISQYLWSNSILKANSFQNGSINNGRDVIMYAERKALQYGNAQGLSDLSGVNNYVYALIGAQLQLANQVYSNGSGGVVPSPSGGGGGLTPYPINVVISAGQSGLMTLTDSAWIGLQDINQVVINQSVFQVGTGFTFNTLIGQFSFALSSYTLQQGDVVTTLGFQPTS